MYHKDHVSSDGHLLGICLGMQLLLSSSDESPGFNGLDIFLVTVLLSHQHLIFPYHTWDGIQLL